MNILANILDEYSTKKLHVLRSSSTEWSESQHHATNAPYVPMVPLIYPYKRQRGAVPLNQCSIVPVIVLSWRRSSGNRPTRATVSSCRSIDRLSVLCSRWCWVHGWRQLLLSNTRRSITSASDRERHRTIYTSCRLYDARETTNWRFAASSSSLSSSSATTSLSGDAVTSWCGPVVTSSVYVSSWPLPCCSHLSPLVEVINRSLCCWLIML